MHLVTNVTVHPDDVDDIAPGRHPLPAEVADPFRQWISVRVGDSSIQLAGTPEQLIAFTAQLNEVAHQLSAFAQHPAGQILAGPES